MSNSTAPTIASVRAAFNAIEHVFPKEAFALWAWLVQLFSATFDEITLASAAHVEPLAVNGALKIVAEEIKKIHDACLLPDTPMRRSRIGIIRISSTIPNIERILGSLRACAMLQWQQFLQAKAAKQATKHAIDSVDDEQVTGQVINSVDDEQVNI